MNTRSLFSLCVSPQKGLKGSSLLAHPKVPTLGKCSSPGTSQSPPCCAGHPEHRGRSPAHWVSLPPTALGITGLSHQGFPWSAGGKGAGHGFPFPALTLVFCVLKLKPEKQTKSGSFLDLFRKKNLRKVTLIMSCVW